MAAFSHSRPGASPVLFLGDALCVLGAYVLAAMLTAPAPDIILSRMVNYAPYLIIVTLVGVTSAIERKLWHIHQDLDVIPHLTAVLKTVGDATICCVFIIVLFMPEGIDRKFLLGFCFGTLVALLGFRAVVHLAVWRIRELGVGLRNSLVIGANARTIHLIEVLRARPGLGHRLVGLLEDEAERAKLLEDFDIPYLGAVAELNEVLGRYEVDEVYISLPVRSYYQQIQDIAHLCEGQGVTVHLLADLFPLRVATSRLMHIEDIPLLSLSTIPEAHFRMAVKNTFDFAVSTCLILLLSPILLSLAILIKLDSRGPLLFFQERVGQNQRRFKMLKFRTMVTNAEELRAELEAWNEADGPVFKIKDDPRITRVGKYLRKYSLDEFPQLFNVWIGEMSLVGPRPPIPKEVEGYTWSQRRRLSVRPGMTGLWQVSGRSDTSFQEWVELDLQYIDNWSLWNDFLILLRTFKAVAVGRGAS